MYLEPGRKDFNYLKHALLLDDRWTTYENRKFCFAEFDDNEKPVRWLYDTFIAFPTIDSNNMGCVDINIGTTMSGEGDFFAVPSPNPGTLQDWENSCSYYFKEGGMLDRLHNEAAKIADVLGKPENKINIILLMNYPAHNQCVFGKVNNKKLNFSVLGQNLDKASRDRLTACKYYADKIISEWKKKQKSIPLFNFLGFYWGFETLYRSWDIDDHWVLKELKKHINSIGLKLFWIPFWCTYNVHILDDYESYYFDAAFLQPNYIFYEDLKGVGDAANAAKKRHAGIEMEFYVDIGEATFSKKTREMRLKRYSEYLDGGIKYGYMKESAIAWFIGDDGLAKLYKSKNPVDRKLYKDTCRFIHCEYKKK